MYILDIYFVINTKKFKSQMSVFTIISSYFILFGISLSATYKMIMETKYISNNTSYIFLIGLFIGFLGLIFIVIEAYFKVIRDNKHYKKVFWIFIVCFIALLSFAIFCIIMANLSR